jgi:hypothetical protein
MSLFVSSALRFNYFPFYFVNIFTQQNQPDATYFSTGEYL